ncbi:Chondroadherin-like protein, partial [Stegodyphus mimosarum]
MHFCRIIKVNDLEQTMRVFFTAIWLLFALNRVSAGSICPDRKYIYPCTCANVGQGKKIWTIVVCARLADTDSLNHIIDSLKSINMDKFLLYDSFWDAHGREDEEKQKLPNNWVTNLRAKEMEIVDTKLSSCFACQSTFSCRNSVTNRFSVLNGTSASEICTLCDSGRGDKYPWTNCMSKLEHFHFTHGKLSTLKESFFPKPMPALRVLNLTYNQIRLIERRALSKLPKLQSLDLSHNFIQHISQMFETNLGTLKFIDLSWNFIKEIGPDFFQRVPKLVHLNLDNNYFEYLVMKDWKKVPDTIRRIYIRDNPIICNCSLRFINETFTSKVKFVGDCKNA